MPSLFAPANPDHLFPSGPSAVPGGFSATGGGAQTVIARGVRVEGDFRSQGNVVIEGELVGSLTCGGHLTIGPEASIQAAVHAEEATIAGSIAGNVAVTRKAELKATANIKGDVTAETAAIEPGAVLEGTFKFGLGKAGDKPVSAPAAASKLKPEPQINTPAEARSGSSA